MRPLERAAPAVVGLGIIAAFFGSMWLDTRHDPIRPTATEADTPLPVAAAPESAEPARTPPGVVSFLKFAEREAPETLPLDHSYTAEGIRRLAAAIEALDGSTLARDRARRLRAAAEEMQADPHSLRHADLARAAFDLATQALLALRDVPLKADGASRLAQAAQAVRRGDPLRIQSAAVDRYFDLAAARVEAELRGQTPKPPLGV